MSIPTYNLGYPQNGSTLGQSKATIRNNLDGTFLTVSVNHYNQNSSYPGQHKFIQFPNSSMFAPPVPNLGTEIDLYNGGSTLGGANNLFLLPPGSTSLSQAIQLTRSANAPIAAANGYSWLPGGLLIQWGSVTTAGPVTPVLFSVAFTVLPYFVTAFRQQSTDTVLGYSGLALSGFNINANGASSAATILWMAIGI